MEHHHILSDFASNSDAHFLVNTVTSKYESGDARQRIEQVAGEPRRLGDIRDLRKLKENQIWRVSLADVQRIALGNTAIVRDRSQFLSPSNSLFVNAEATPSAYDVLIQRAGLRSVDAAEAAFNPRLASGVQWGRNSLVQGNNFGTGASSRSDIFVSDTGTVYASLDKPLQNGSKISLIHNWNYALNNLPSQSFNSRYVGFVRGEFRQPLWAGRGREFTGIAGPQSYLRGNLGRGVTVARIDENISLVEFESRLQTLIKQTEELYWDVWQAHQGYYSHAAARDSAELIWKQLSIRKATGLNGGETADEAQAQESFYERQERADAALAEVFAAEARLRRLIGLPVSADQVLWPIKDPIITELIFDWHSSLANAISRRGEIQQQKLRIHRLELQLKAAKNLAHPQLDLVTGIQANGLGGTVGSGGGGNNSGMLLNADELGWNAGIEFSIPIGFGIERARIRNLDLQLAKARAVLSAQKDEIGHELNHAIRSLDRWFASIQSNENRRKAANRRLAAVKVEYGVGRSSLDNLLRSQVALAEAELAHFQSIAEYNKAIADFQYRKGTLLSQNNIALEELHE